MDIFILEDYVTSRREMKKQQSQKSRQQKQKFQIQISQISSHDGSLLPTPRDSPSGLTSTAAMTSSSSSSVATSASASAATRFPNASAKGRAFSTDHLFESFKPY